MFHMDFGSKKVVKINRQYYNAFIYIHSFINLNHNSKLNGFFLCGEFGLVNNYDFKYVCLYMRNSFLFNLFIIQTFMEHRRGSLAECSLQCKYIKYD